MWSIYRAVKRNPSVQTSICQSGLAIVHAHQVSVAFIYILNHFFLNKG